MRLTEIMRKAVETVSPSIPAGDAWQLMQLRRIHHLVVMNEHRVVGIFSDRDAGGMRGEGVRKDRAVADLMTPQVVTALPTTTIREAANLMRGRSIGCLPVVENGCLVGIVTLSDLLTLIGRGAERPAPRTKRWTLKSRGARGQGMFSHKGLPAR
jgi:acetoin utilization protein AcuB